MLEPVKAAFGEYVGRYYASLTPTTKGVESFIARGLSNAIAWAPARMVDAAEEMLHLWMRTDHDAAKPAKPAPLPAMLVALARDYTPSPRDFNRQVAERVMVQLPDDPKERIFGLRMIAGDIRAQIAIFASEPNTAQSLAAQLLLYADTGPGRRFKAIYRFAGHNLAWPVVLESPEVLAVNLGLEGKAVAGLAVDLTLRVSIPVFDAPRAGEPNDGLGVPGTDDPAGYPRVQLINVDSNALTPEGRKGEDVADYLVDDSGVTRL